MARNVVQCEIFWLILKHCVEDEKSKLSLEISNDLRELKSCSSIQRTDVRTSKCQKLAKLKSLLYSILRCMLHEAEALLLLEMHFELWKRRFSHLQCAVKQLSYLFFETYQNENFDCFSKISNKEALFSTW